MRVLEVKNLTKRFNDFVAVDNISFNLKEGEILGVLGPNGAGKTTTLQMLLGVLTPTSGLVKYFGKELSGNKEYVSERINFSSTYTNLPWRLTVRENLTFISYLYEIKDRKNRLEKIKKIFRLEELWDKTMTELSAGQQTRVNLAKSFVNFPRVLLLDEPTASLDPEVAKYIREFLLGERKKFNVSIIITSHNMAEVEELCDRVIFINHGTIIADDTPEHLAKTLNVSRVTLMITDGMKRTIQISKKKKLDFTTEGRYITISLEEKAVPYFLKEILEKGIEYSEISIAKPTLQDYFLQAVEKDKKI